MSQNTASSRSTPGIVDAAWRHRWLVVAATLVFGALGYGASQFQEPTFSATATLTLTDPRESSIFDSRGGVDPERYVLQQADLLTSRTILETAAERLGGELSASDLEDRLTTDRSIELSQLTITASAGGAEEAAEIANTVALAYQDFARDQVQSRAQVAIAELEPLVNQLQTELDEVRTEGDDGDPTSDARAQVLTQRMFDLDARTQQLAVDAAVFGSGVSIFEPAEPPIGPSSPRPTRTAIATALVGGFLGVLAAFWWTSASRSIQDRDEPARILGAPLLGDVPLVPSRTDMVDLGEHPGVQEAFQFVLGSIEFALSEKRGRSVLITSAVPGAGKTVTSLQLAAAAVREGQRVLLVDADLRASGLSQLLRADLLPGLIQLVRDPAGDPADVIYHCWIGDGVRLPVIAAGRQEGQGPSWVPTGGMDRVIDRLRHHELVILDSAPLLAVADTGALVNAADGVVLVVRHGSSQKELQLALERLAFTRTPLLGYVYLSPDPPSAVYGYGYGYGSERPAAASAGGSFRPAWLRSRRPGDNGRGRSDSLAPPPRQGR